MISTNNHASPNLRMHSRWTALVLVRTCCLAVLAAGCGDSAGAERAAQDARIASLEQQLQQLKAAAKAQAEAAAQPSIAGGKHPFKVACKQPWLLHQPLGASLWTCRAPNATPEGLYPQCAVTFQPQGAIETSIYHEFALNAVPPLRQLKNMKDQRTKLRGADAFEATFEADAVSVPQKMLSVLVPYKEYTYTITCSAPKASFDKYSPAFRQIIDTFGFD